MVWPKEDRIRWVEQRLNERTSGNYEARDLDAKKVPDQISLQVWLAKERDGLSWQQIMIKYPQFAKGSKSAGISKVRRAHMRIERALQPTLKESRRHILDAQIQSLFGCSPLHFKEYLESIQTRKPRK
jgi:hypothetical protein